MAGAHGNLHRAKRWDFLFSGLMVWIPSFSLAALISGGCCVCACLGLVQNTCRSSSSRPSSKAWSREKCSLKIQELLLPPVHADTEFPRISCRGGRHSLHPTLCEFTSGLGRRHSRQMEGSSIVTPPSLKSTLARADVFSCIFYCQGLWRGECTVDPWSCFFRISFDWKWLAVPSAAGSITEQRARWVSQGTAAMPARKRFWLWKCLAALENSTRGWGIVAASGTRREAVWCYKWEEHRLRPQRYRWECRPSHRLTAWSWPWYSHLQNGNEKIPPYTFGRESMRTCRMFSFFPPNSKSSLEILKLSGWPLNTLSLSSSFIHHSFSLHLPTVRKKKKTENIFVTLIF